MVGDMVGYPKGALVSADSDTVWADVLHLTCVTCGAGVDEYCVLTGNSKTYKKHLPCLSRLKAAERQVS